MAAADADYSSDFDLSAGAVYYEAVKDGSTVDENWQDRNFDSLDCFGRGCFEVAGGKSCFAFFVSDFRI